MGKHRKSHSTQTARSRVLMAAAATGVVSTAGVGGAAAADAIHGDKVEVPARYAFSAYTAGEQDGASLPQAAPQVLEAPEAAPALENVDEQVAKAIASHQERIDQENEERERAEAERQEAEQRAAAGQVEEKTGLTATTQAGVAKPAQGTLTSTFGVRWGSMHQGLDIANSEGTPIVAAMSGVVIDAGPASGFGNWVRIQHDDGTITVYGHMSSIDVSVGQQVQAGQKIAGMGSMGFSTGTHLHFEVHPNGGGAIDPLPWLTERGISL
ncbi:M23 family metallopeptidase [Corynebacterium otitidis]|uniref:M23 family metallopeptidase n=1 Tax=Corynebacterium otitidis TaxID=29321 RepID=UPI000627C81B|nr:M23 family metallopeptidase [Corynebacterium otitidis]KKO82904.1 membrane protein [Corynebacterium otitidis]